MFEVNGIPIYIDEISVLKQLRDEVYTATGKHILKKMKRSGNNIMVCCPIHNHGQEKTPSCGISTKRYKDRPAGTVHCFACGYVDTLDGMIAKCFGHDNSAYGTTWLVNNFVTSDSDQRRPILQGLTREVKKVENFVSEEELATYRYYHPYMFKRKLTKEIIEKYDVGYQKDFVFVDEEGKKWEPQEVVTFPVRDKKGRCLFVSRRTIHGKTFFLPLNIDKPVYGIYELPENCREVVICESVFNALTSVIYGRPAVALFGTGSSNQYKILNELPARKYVIALDPDKAGMLGTYKLTHALKGKFLSKLIIPKGKDINDLSLQEFQNLKEISI